MGLFPYANEINIALDILEPVPGILKWGFLALAIIQVFIIIFLLAILGVLVGIFYSLNPDLEVCFPI